MAPTNMAQDQQKAIEPEDDRDKKKIDFKEKAVKAKEASMKKVLAKSKKSANSGGGGRGGPNSGKASGV